MPTSMFPTRLALSGLAAIVLVAGAASPPAHAQPQYYESASSGGEITVYAPRHLQRDPGTGAEIDVVTASRTVYYGDLDLSAPAGMDELHARLERAAGKACDQLNNDPTLVIINSEDNCVAPAVRDAMYRVETPGDGD